LRVNRIGHRAYTALVPNAEDHVPLLLSKLPFSRHCIIRPVLLSGRPGQRLLG
jgi:hypothetical protein